LRLFGSIKADAVARGAGELARTLLPIEPINDIFKNIYINITIPMTIFIDLNTVFSPPFVSSAGIAHISKPVKGK
jgi:hypothetical protein